MGGHIVADITQGLLNLGVTVIGSGLVVGGTIWWGMRVQASKAEKSLYGKIEKIHEFTQGKIDKITEQVQVIEKHIWPAIKNGSLITSNSLDQRLKILEASYDQRQQLSEARISNKFKSLSAEIERLQRDNEVDHLFTKKDAEDLYMRMITNRVKGT
jgi:hypothetical protein